MTPQEAVAIIGGLAGIVGGFVAWTKSHAERDNLAVDTMRDVLDEVRTELKKEQAIRHRCENRIEIMAAELKTLSMQIIRTENQVDANARKVAFLENWVRAQGALPEGIDGYPI